LNTILHGKASRKLLTTAIPTRPMNTTSGYYCGIHHLRINPAKEKNFELTSTAVLLTRTKPTIVNYLLNSCKLNRGKRIASQFSPSIAAETQMKMSHPVTADPHPTRIEFPRRSLQSTSDEAQSNNKRQMVPRILHTPGSALPPQTLRFNSIYAHKSTAKTPLSLWKSHGKIRQ